MDFYTHFRTNLLCIDAYSAATIDRTLHLQCARKGRRNCSIRGISARSCPPARATASGRISQFRDERLGRSGILLQLPFPVNHLVGTN